MSVSTTALADTLPSSIPKLDPTSSNWTVFLFRFQDAVDAKGFWGHFDGTSVIPTLSTPPVAAEVAEKTQWEKDERSSKSLLTQKFQVAGLYSGVDTLKEVGEGEVGGSGEGIYIEERVCEDGVEGKVFGDEMYGQGWCEGVS